MLATSLARTYWPEKSNAAIGIMTALYGIGQIVGPLAATRVAIMTGSYRFALPIAGAALLVPTGVFAIRLLSRRSVRA
jgi:MFS family permease